MKRLGVDLGGTKVEGVVLDANNQILAKRRLPTPSADYGQILDTLVALILELEQQVRDRCSVGIGMPGAISPHSGLIKNANTEVLNGENLPKDLEQLLGRKIYAANDANCLALSESVDGAGKGAESVFAVILGTGTGGGLVINGQLMVGANAIAGEWGHNPLPWAEATDIAVRCYCGKIGCIETYLSGAGLSRLHVTLGGADISAQRVSELYESGDKTAIAAIGLYASRSARALATTINIVDPSVVVLGGGLSKINNLAAAVESKLPEFVFSDHVSTRVVPALHGDSSGVRGAAWLPLQ